MRGPVGVGALPPRRGLDASFFNDFYNKGHHGEEENPSQSQKSKAGCDPEEGSDTSSSAHQAVG
jgi:hypothetical protein